MSKNFVSAILAFLLLLLLIARVSDPIFFVSLFIFIILTAAVNYALYFRSLHRIFDLTFLLYPTFWIVACANLVFLSPNLSWRLFFVILCALGFWALQAELSPFGSSQALDVLFFFSVFGVFLAVWSLDFYYTPGWWIIIALIFVLDCLFFWATFYSSSAMFRTKIIYSLISAFLMTQLGWALLFWPLHFFSTTLVFFGFFYLLWISTRFHLQKNLNREKIIFHVVFTVVIQLLVTLTTPWLPLR